MPTTGSPTNNPTAKPVTASPTNDPTAKPTTGSPTNIPTAKPTTASPTNNPTAKPVTDSPTTAKPTTGSPTNIPTAKPTTASPTNNPTVKPTTASPTNVPTAKPTTASPTSNPTAKPVTDSPTTAKPTTGSPTNIPTAKPTTASPTNNPTAKPVTDSPTTAKPTTASPTDNPTAKPTTASPTNNPTAKPVTDSPTTAKPTTGSPTNIPTAKPTTANPTNNPTVKPVTDSPTTAKPTTGSPTNIPTAKPTTASPTKTPTVKPVSLTFHPSSIPSGEPSGAPSLTAPPSATPSGEPSQAPSVSSLPSMTDPSLTPTSDPLTPSMPSNWEIVYNNQNLILDFSLDSDHELTLDYDISAGRDYELEVFADCGTETPAGILTLANAVSLPQNNSHDKLIVAYDVDKAAIADSSLWNETASELQFCQRVSLVTPDTDACPGRPVVTENTDMTIFLDLKLDFEFDNDLGEAANSMASKGGGSANLASFVDVYKCNSDGGFAPDPSPLLPNVKLFLCVRSLSTEVEIGLIESMTVTQDTSGTQFDVVLNGAIRNPSMTDWRYDSKGWVVSTRVPTRLFNGNRFSFRPEESVTVYGTVKLELFTLSGRKLRFVADNANKLDKGKKEASYEVKVQLAQINDMETNFGIGLSTSASFFRRMLLVSTTTVIALISAVL